MAARPIGTRSSILSNSPLKFIEHGRGDVAGTDRIHPDSSPSGPLDREVAGQAEQAGLRRGISRLGSPVLTRPRTLETFTIVPLCDITRAMPWHIQ